MVSQIPPVRLAFKRPLFIICRKKSELNPLSSAASVREISSPMVRGSMGVVVGGWWSSGVMVILVYEWVWPFVGAGGMLS